MVSCPPVHVGNSQMWHKAGRNWDQAGVSLNPVPLSVEDKLIRKQMMVNAADIKAHPCTSSRRMQGMPGASAQPGEPSTERWRREQIPELQLLPAW